jgi:nucleoid-associated protein YgaU
MHRIQIVLVRRELTFFKGDNPVNTYPIAIGKPSTPTPPGHWSVVNKTVNPGGVLGSRWMGLSIPTTRGPYGIHGTNAPWNIGKAVSNGCIRMHNHNVEEIFPEIPLGTAVDIFSGNEGLLQTPGLAGPGGSRTYVVQAGDTLWKISRRFGTSVSTLVHFNNLPDPDHLSVGQILLLP